jgi:hypothetical protein
LNKKKKKEERRREVRLRLTYYPAAHIHRRELKVRVQGYRGTGFRAEMIAV